MASLDLGTLSVGVKVNGADKAKTDLKGVADAAKATGAGATSATSPLTSLFSSFKTGVGNTNILGTSLSGLWKSFSTGGGMSAVLGGAMAGLTAKFVELAVQGIQMAIAAMSKFIQEGYKLASSLQEVQNVVDVTFGESAKEINKWAKTSASAYGLTELQAKKYSSTLGAMYKSMGMGQEVTKTMSKNMTQLTGDLASFYNLDYETAFQKLRSGIAGEVEPLRQLGISLTEANLKNYALSIGMEYNTKTMSEAEKATIRYQYIMKATTDAQGDYSRTADSSANSQRTFNNEMDKAKTTLMTGFLPAMATTYQSMTSFISANMGTISLIGNILGAGLNSIMKFVEIIQVPIKAVMDMVSTIAKPISEAFEIISTDAEKLYDKITESIGMANKKIAAGYEDLKSETKETFAVMQDAANNYMKNELQQYEAELRAKAESDGKISLNEEVRIAKQVSKRAAILQQEIDSKKKMYSLDSDYAYDAEALKTKNVIAEVSKRQSVYVKFFNAIRGKSDSSTTATMPAYASGTDNAIGGLSLVGEKGPEILNIKKGSQIINNKTTQQLFNNQQNSNDRGVKIDNMTVVANNPMEFMEQLEIMQRRGA